MSRSVRIKGPARIRGSLELPGDKSISHRVAMLASIARGTSVVSGLASSADCRTTLECIRRLGIRVEDAGSKVLIHGQGLLGYCPARSPVELDAGNSGSTIRMLTGLLAGQRFTSRIDGDESLRKRPMGRIIEPLRLMGARIEAADGNLAPLTIHSARLHSIDYPSPVASAQVKSCVLFAGLLAEGRTTFSEPAQSRNHTELMLREMGARIDIDSSGTVAVEGSHELMPVSLHVPGDLSSAAFFVAAASVLRDSTLRLENVNLNPTRSAFIQVMQTLGADITKENVRREHNELVGDLLVTGSALRTERGGSVLSGAVIPNLIDEIPILAVVASQSEGRLEIRNAGELRIKESDRIRTVAEGLRALGGEIDEFEDGFAIEGPQKLSGGYVESAGDHRIAMAMSIAGLISTGTTEIKGAECVSISFPGFFDALSAVAGPDAVRKLD